MPELVDVKAMSDIGFA
ncbi:Protein of unknown function [Bacillus wiedmannii]|uniref:Uncharacterized protein n=1 Tax=Bacillus wiedmannii TaxID=1890302 RepID=A0A1C4DK11_9BACI|nr:Protein of unknown function [Bacillus wiedmannii]SCL97417.1 Protein of unknown function [Bacillus wiedmannii]